MRMLLLVAVMFMAIIQAKAQSFTYHPLKEFRGDNHIFIKKLSGAKQILCW